MLRSVLVLVSVLLVALTSSPNVALADDGITRTVTFVPGSGPIASTVVPADQYAALPPDPQAFLDTHRIGDTWTVNVTVASTPSAGGQMALSGCPDPNNCDNFNISLDVQISPFGNAWTTRASA